jgi:hypothetical protein
MLFISQNPRFDATLLEIELFSHVEDRLMDFSQFKSLYKAFVQFKVQERNIKSSYKIYLWQTMARLLADLMLLIWNICKSK